MKAYEMILASDGLKSRGVEIAPSLTRLIANSAMGTEGLIPLWFGEPNVQTPKMICDAAASSLSKGETFYAEGLGKPYLREAIAEYMTSLYQVNINSDRIAVTVSGGNALNLAFQTLLEPGDKVATLIPAFPNLLNVPALQGAELITHPLEVKNGRWTLNCDAFLEKVKKAKVVLINSPSNPTGFMLTQAEIDKISATLRERGTWIIADEVYSRTVYEEKVAPSFIKASLPEDKLIVVNSFSKTWAMTGWRLGWLTLPSSLAPIVEKLMEFSVACAPAFTQRGGVVALREGETFIKQTNEMYRDARDLVCETLHESHNITCPIPHSSFYAFFRINTVDDSVEYTRMLIEKAKIGLAPGDAFLMPEPGWFRLCFAQTQDILEEALDRLKPYL